MTRKEAIEWMDWLMMDVRERGYNDIVAALNMAIKALEQEPCEDCVSRKALRELVDFVQSIKAEHNENGHPINYGTICDILIKGYELLKTSSVQPTRIHASWKAADNYNYRCSKCKHVSPWDYAYCPYCGEKMESEDKE